MSPDGETWQMCVYYTSFNAFMLRVIAVRQLLASGSAGSNGNVLPNACN